jgi:hypothetical protein
MHANILAYPEREAVHNKLIRQSENGSFGCSIGNHVLPNRLIQSMKTSAKATFPQHRWDVAMLLQKDSGFLDVAGKIRMSDNECRHQFGVCHFGVVPVFYAKTFEKVVTDAVDGGNTIDHGFPLFVFV